MLLVLPAPMLFLVDALVRRTSPRHQAQVVTSRTAARDPNSATQTVRNPSPPSSRELDEPAFVVPQQWLEEDDRPPTYEEAIRMPKLELVDAPGVHHGAPAAV